MKTDYFQRLILELKNKLISVNFYFQGEPYINPSFLEMVAFAKKHRLYTTSSTNAHFLDEKNCIETIESGLDELVISIDGITQEVYESYRKSGSLSQALDGLERLVLLKKKMNSSTPYIIVQFLITRENEHQLPALKQFFKKRGINKLRLKTLQVYSFVNDHPLIPSDDKLSRYRKGKDGQYVLKSALGNSCWRLWSRSVVCWDGTIVPCCFDKDADYALGNIKEDKFVSIWNSDAYNNFRKNVFSDRTEIDICNNCTEGCQVWA